jgi:hypothetical protein
VLGALVDAFRRFGEEAQIVGRLLTGYTAIEYQLCMCAGMGGGDVERAISDLYPSRNLSRLLPYYRNSRRIVRWADRHGQRSFRYPFRTGAA